ncbi:hypothetical protein [Geminocystis sp.]|uniref:hypothetical protein n=1 Tax=Geminocystis sp. TaxID=2664100 RepID=UPI003593F1D9
MIVRQLATELSSKMGTKVTPAKVNMEFDRPTCIKASSFIPFFEQVEKTRDLCLQGVCVYLTDGYGDSPRDKPSLPVLWVVVQGGLDSDIFVSNRDSDIFFVLLRHFFLLLTFFIAVVILIVWI